MRLQTQKGRSPGLRSPAPLVHLGVVKGGALFAEQLLVELRRVQSYYAFKGLGNRNGWEKGPAALPWEGR